MNEFILDTKAIYINFPYCKDICSYCHYIPNLSFGFTKIPDEYFDLILAELEDQKYRFENKKLESLYLGGGTPSLLSDKQLDELFSFFSKVNTRFEEISIEIHPQNINFDIVGNPYFTRYSIGVQSLDKKTLSKYNRSYNRLNISSLLSKIKLRKNTSLNVDFIFQSTFDKKNLSEILTYCPNSITIYPDTKGKGLERLNHIYDTLDDLRSFFKSHGGYKELGHSGYIYIRNDSRQSNYSRVQNEFLGNIIGIGNNAISDIDDKSFLSLYDISSKKIIHKERYSKDRFIKSICNSAAVGITKRMIQMVVPELLYSNLLNTLDNKSILEKHVCLSEDDLIYIPEYNYSLFYDFIYQKYGEKYALIFLNYISYFDCDITHNIFFNYFSLRISKNSILSSNIDSIKRKKKIPNIRILIEGIDGSGKDTFAELLADSLKNHFYYEENRSISIVGQPVSRLCKGKEAKYFIEERTFEGTETDIIKILTTNRVCSEQEFSQKKGIHICIRGLLTDLATLKATFGKECSSLLGLKRKYDYAFIITVDPKVAFERIQKRNAPRQWRESIEWLNFFQQYYKTFPLDKISENNYIIYNNDLKKLEDIAKEVADSIYKRW